MKSPEQLIKSAEKLNHISEETQKDYSARKDQIIAKTNELMLNHKNIHSLIGEESESKMIINHTNHVRFMESIFTNFNSKILVNSILWVYRTYRKHGFDPKYWEIAFANYDEAVKEILNKDAYLEVSKYYNWFKQNHRHFVALTNDNEDS